MVSPDVLAPVGKRFESLAEELLAEPSRTPEILALAAVETIGPRAKAWAARARDTYPSASPQALARLAAGRFTRTAGLRGALGAVAGPYAPVALTAAIVVTHAELVLHVAAAFGLDPEDPERARDLLKLASPGSGPFVAWAVLRLANRALPGVSLVSAVLGARATAGMVAARAQRFYTESQSSQVSGSSS